MVCWHWVRWHRPLLCIHAILRCSVHEPLCPSSKKTQSMVYIHWTFPVYSSHLAWSVITSYSTLIDFGVVCEVFHCWACPYPCASLSRSVVKAAPLGIRTAGTLLSSLPTNYSLLMGQVMHDQTDIVLGIPPSSIVPVSSLVRRMRCGPNFWDSSFEYKPLSSRLVDAKAVGGWFR